MYTAVQSPFYKLFYYKDKGNSERLLCQMNLDGRLVYFDEARKKPIK
jgi:hypothetical protein